MIINCTPHYLTIVGGPTDIILAPSGIAPRCVPTRVPLPDTDGIATVHTSLGAVQGLPDAVAGTHLIVSALVLSACPDRADLRSPGEAVRNDAGVIIGCKGLCA